MKALFSNVSGFGARGRRDQIKDIVRGDSTDLIGLIETFKPSFSPRELFAVAGVDRFNWNCLPSSGHSGGILIGSKREVFNFVTFNHGIFWASSIVFHRQLNTI